MTDSFQHSCCEHKALCQEPELPGRCVQSRPRTQHTAPDGGLPSSPKHTGGIWKVVDEDGLEVYLKTRNLKSETSRMAIFLS